MLFFPMSLLNPYDEKGKVYTDLERQEWGRYNVWLYFYYSIEKGGSKMVDFMRIFQVATLSTPCLLHWVCFHNSSVQFSHFLVRYTVFFFSLLFWILFFLPFLSFLFSVSFSVPMSVEFHSLTTLITDADLLNYLYRAPRRYFVN